MFCFPAFEYPILFGDDELDDNNDEQLPEEELPADNPTYVADPNLDESLSEDSTRILDELIAEDARLEQELSADFEDNPDLLYLSRIPCFAHRIQCVVRDFDKSQRLGIVARIKAKRIIKFFGTSHTAMKKLQGKIPSVFQIQAPPPPPNPGTLPPPPTQGLEIEA